MACINIQGLVKKTRKTSNLRKEIFKESFTYIYFIVIHTHKRQKIEVIDEL